jgi:Glycosyl transferase family 2
VALAIRSVLDQNFSDLEIIVVDDGSTDETEAVVTNIDAGVRFLKQQRGGPGAARNLGWSVARGEYIGFLDSDDVWFPWTSRTYLRCIEEFKQPAFIVGTPFRFSSEEELAAVRQSCISAAFYRDYFASAAKPIWVGAGGMLLHRSCIARFEASRMNGEDHDLALHLGEQPGFVWIKKPFTFGYRRHHLTEVLDLGQTLQGMRHLIFEEKLSRFPGGERRRRERLELITRSVRPPALEAVRQNQLWSALQLYFKTFCWHVRLRRWKFLLALPLLVLVSPAKQILRRGARGKKPKPELRQLSHPVSKE